LAHYDVAWREKNPSDDLITELLGVEFEDVSGTRRRLTREELLVFLTVIAGAGVDTTGQLFGWIGKVLAENPDQRELAQDPSLVPNAIEELLRYEPPGPHVARYVAESVEVHGRIVPVGSALLLMWRRPTGTSVASRSPTASTSIARSLST
jgi:cytochrome P450